MESDKVKETVISGFVSLFGNLRANFLLTAAFNECHNIEKKHDCIREALNAVKEETELFIQRLQQVILLHTNVLNEQPVIVEKINEILYPLRTKYNSKDEKLIPTNSYVSVLFNREENFIQIDTIFVSNVFYLSLINEINACFRCETFNATQIMIRKLFENLLIDILRKRYKGDSEKEFLYWNSKSFVKFHTLIENLKVNLSDFRMFSKKMDNKLISFLNCFVRLPANSSVHTLEEIINKEELEKRKREINFYCGLLFSVLDKQ